MRLTFVKTKNGGYVNMAFVEYIGVSDKQIILEDRSGYNYTFDGEFEDEQTAQTFLDELIEELESE